MIDNIILETTFTKVKPGDGIVAHKLVLHKENDNIVYHQVQTDGSGWNRAEFHDDLEKALKHFLKMLREDRKSFLGSKSMEVILPATPARAPRNDAAEIEDRIEELTIGHEAFMAGHPEKKTRLCQDQSEIGNYLSDAYDANIAVLSTSQQALITIMRQGGSWAERVYDAMFDVIDPLLKRIVRPPAED
jgi:hypothetical protein